MRPRRLVLALCLLAGACDRKSLTGGLEPEPAGIPVIALSAASAAFIGPARSMAPMQMIAISNSGSGTLGGLGIDTLEYLDDSSGWLTASLSSVTAPGMLALRQRQGTSSPVPTTPRSQVARSLSREVGCFREPRVRGCRPRARSRPGSSPR